MGNKYSKTSLSGRLRAVCLFSVVRRAKRETRKWPRVWLMARDGRGKKKERLPAKPERMVFRGPVIFWRQNWSVDRPGTWNVTLEFAWTTEVFPTFLFKEQLMQCIESESHILRSWSWSISLILIIHFLCFMFWMRLPVAIFFFAGCWIFTWQCSTYPNCSLTKAKPTLQVTQDHSLGADLFFFLSWESLFYSAMSCSASVGNYYCFCFIK